MVDNGIDVNFDSHLKKKRGKCYVSIHETKRNKKISHVKHSTKRAVVHVYSSKAPWHIEKPCLGTPWRYRSVIGVCTTLADSESTIATR